MKIFTFGKYKGCSVLDILNENPAYVEWCVNNIKWFSLDDTEQKMLNKITKAINIVYYQYPDSFPRGKGASKILVKRALEYIENKNAFILKYKKNCSNVNCLKSMAHSLFKEFDQMSDSEMEEMNDISDRILYNRIRWEMCIPYNDETKSLAGITDDCAEYYK